MTRRSDRVCIDMTIRDLHVEGISALKKLNPKGSIEMLLNNLSAINLNCYSDKQTPKRQIKPVQNAHVNLRGCLVLCLIFFLTGGTKKPIIWLPIHEKEYTRFFYSAVQDTPWASSNLKMPDNKGWYFIGFKGHLSLNHNPFATSTTCREQVWRRLANYKIGIQLRRTTTHSTNRLNQTD